MTNFPAAYRGSRWMHDDWAIAKIPWKLQPWCWIPRRWTGLELMMPPAKVCGNAKPKWIEVQEGYPLAPDAVVHRGSWKVVEGQLLPDPNGDLKIIESMDPVHPAGQWSIQNAYLHIFHRRVPCFLSFSILVPRINRVLHFNGPIKPDVKTNDWYWWLEISLTFKPLVKS